MGHVEVHTGYWWWRNLNERDHLEDLGVGGKGKNVKMDVKDTGSEAADWINLAHGRNIWRAFVNTVMNLQGNLMTS